MLDQISDKNRSGLYKLSKQCSMPEFVKADKLATDDSVNESPSTCFADPINRRYPINSDGDAWASCAYFEKFASHNDYSELEYSKVKSNLEKAAKLWEFEWPVFFEEKIAAAPITINYAFRGETHHTCQVNDFEGLEKVANNVLTDRNKYPWEMRRDVARQILASEDLVDGHFKQASRQSLHKMAGQAIGLVNNATEKLATLKAAFHKNPDIQSRIEECIGLVNKTATDRGLLSPEAADSVIGFIDLLDRSASTNDKYATGQSPEEAIYSLTVADMDIINNNMVKLANGRAISKAEAGSLKTASYIKAVTGKNVDGQPDKAIDILQNLDSHLCEALTDSL